MQRLERIAKLSKEQSAQIRPRVQAAVKQMQSIRAQSILQGSEAFDQAIADIEQMVSPNQQARLEHFRERRRETIQRNLAKQQQ